MTALYCHLFLLFFVQSSVPISSEESRVQRLHATVHGILRRFAPQNDSVGGTTADRTVGIVPYNGTPKRDAASQHECVHTVGADSISARSTKASLV